MFFGLNYSSHVSLVVISFGSWEMNDSVGFEFLLWVYFKVPHHDLATAFPSFFFFFLYFYIIDQCRWRRPTWISCLILLNKITAWISSCRHTPLVPKVRESIISPIQEIPPSDNSKYHSWRGHRRQPQLQRGRNLSELSLHWTSLWLIFYTDL